MKFNKTNKLLSVLLAICIICALLSGAVIPTYANSDIEYTSAEDIVYRYSGNYVANWGARGEISTFLSIMALDFYDNQSYSYDYLSSLDGGRGQGDAHTSELYIELKSIMASNHSHITGYQETRDLYKLTDCEENDIAHISSFYSGKQLNGAWDAGATWNREHTWPRSKCVDTGKSNDSADIMMLRPTWVSENSSRGNDAYGESSGFFEPADEVKGDCARIALYGYTRWGNTSKMWGSSGMIESVAILLKWMEEDPVDTWEMGRNDAVESITGTRNIFIDYPEYAWLLFGEELPTDISTPSGMAGNGASSEAVTTETEAATTETEAATTETEAVTTETEAVTTETEAATETETQTESPTEEESFTFPYPIPETNETEDEAETIPDEGGCSATGSGTFFVISAVSLAGFALFGKKKR